MHRIRNIAAGLCTVLLAAGCATPDSKTADNSVPREQKIYRTGSNLPVKDDDGSVQSLRPDINNRPVLGAPGGAPRGGM